MKIICQSRPRMVGGIQEGSTRTYTPDAELAEVVSAGYQIACEGIVEGRWMSRSKRAYGWHYFVSTPLGMVEMFGRGEDWARNTRIKVFVSGIGDTIWFGFGIKFNGKEVITADQARELVAL